MKRSIVFAEFPRPKGGGVIFLIGSKAQCRLDRDPFCWPEAVGVRTASFSDSPSARQSGEDRSNAAKQIQRNFVLPSLMSFQAPAAIRFCRFDGRADQAQPGAPIQLYPSFDPSTTVLVAASIP